MRGRKPKPSHLRVLEGNPGHRPINPAEPAPPKGIPAPPVFLAGEALAEWHRMGADLADLGVITRIDRAALAAYCQAWARWHQAEQALAIMAAQNPATSALIVKTAAGTAIQNPLVGIANRAMRDMVNYAAEFGMTPSSRARISMPDLPVDDPLARLKRLTLVKS